MDKQRSIIEYVFPVNYVSMETYKERRSAAGQILTGLGKWWGRKPLAYVRAVLLGILMPASNNLEKDLDIYLKLLGMGERELELRKKESIDSVTKYLFMTEEERQKYGAKIEYKNASDLDDFKADVTLRLGDNSFTAETLPPKIAFEYANEEEKQKYFKVTFEKVTNSERKELEKMIFKRLPYELKIRYCYGIDRLDNLSEETWQEINEHLGTNAHSYPELVEQLSKRRFGKLVTVGDPFCGGGNIPFEAARLGFNVYASDLNPIAMLLTWSALNLLSLPEEKIKKLRAFQKKIYELADKQITEWGIEHNSKGHRAVAYLYCTEVVCPDCGWRISLAPSWVIGKKTKTVAVLRENPEKRGFDIEIVMGVSNEAIKEADKNATVRGSGMIYCPHCKVEIPVSVIRGDRTTEDGKTIWGLRRWEKHEFMPRPDDVFQERLYCISYEDKHGNRYYKTPDDEDLERERKVIELLKERFDEWQKKGYIPSDMIEEGEETSRLYRERGWTYWHQLFNPRQLLLHGLLMELIDKEAKTKEEKIVGLLGINRCCNWNSKLSRWNPAGAGGLGKVEDTFYNQALNTLYVYGTRSMSFIQNSWFIDILNFKINKTLFFGLTDARNITISSTFWITDPPYADAVNYHELSEFFLAWDKKFLKEIFPDWYTDSRRSLAIKGTDETFKMSMTEALKKIADNTYENGYVAIMFTHQDTKVYADLVESLLKTGLKVLNAWSVSTETEAGGLKKGNYVQSTVTIILQKDAETTREPVIISDLTRATKQEIEKQINLMMGIERASGKTLFSPIDYELAGCYAALRVLTSFNLQATSEEIENFIDNMRRYASNFIIPAGFKELHYDPATVKEVWDKMDVYEKYYIRGLEFEKLNDKKIKNYQDMAKSLGVNNYDELLGETKPNNVRVKTAKELGLTLIDTQHGFSRTDLRYVLASIYIAITKGEEVNNETEGITTGFKWLKDKLGRDYWYKKQKLEILLRYISLLGKNAGMSHWAEESKIASYLAERVATDKI